LRHLRLDPRLLQRMLALRGAADLR